MSYILYLLRLLWRVYFLVDFSLHLLFGYPVYLILFWRKTKFTAAFNMVRFMTRSILLFAGVWGRVKFEEKLDGGKVYIFCPNHVSYLDIIMCYYAIPVYNIFMGKNELEKVPVFNTFFKKFSISVNRKSTIGSHKAFLQAREEIDKGNSLIIFPEGTISKIAPELIPFKNGPFKLAIEKQVPIVPVIFLDNWKIIAHYDNLKKYGGPGISRVIIHRPVETYGMTDADLEPLKAKVRKILRQTLVEGKILSEESH